METCKRCGKRFVVTSWTRDRFWRGVCPRCIVELCEAAIAAIQGENEWTGREE